MLPSVWIAFSSREALVGVLDVRIDDSDTSLQSIIETAFTTTTGENLSLDDHIVPTYSLRNGLGFVGGLCDLARRHTDAILATVSRCFGAQRAGPLTDLRRLAERYSWMDKFRTCCCRIELRIGESWQWHVSFSGSSNWDEHMP